MEVGGVMVEGAQNIFFAQLADPSTTEFSVEATRFMSGKFPLMIFGLPGAGGAVLLADTAHGTYRLRRFSVSVLFHLCGESLLHRSGGFDCQRMAEAGGLRSAELWR